MPQYVVISTYLNNETSCRCLMECVAYAAKYYSNIIIIDDSPETNVNIYQLKFPIRVKIIKNQFHGAGELTRIWYFWKLCKQGDVGILIHDSTFINTRIPVFKYDYVPLFSFIHKWDDVDNELHFLRHYPKLYFKYLDKSSWDGAFGVQYEIKWDFLNKCMQKYKDLFNELLTEVRTRDMRSCMERVIQVIFHGCSENTTKSIFGTIHDFTTRYWGSQWGVSYEDYAKRRGRCSHIPIIKVWVGR